MSDSVIIRKESKTVPMILLKLPLKARNQIKITWRNNNSCMNQYYIAGALDIIAGCIILYFAFKIYKQYKLRKSRRSRFLLILSVFVGLCQLALGIIGICKNTLDGVNLLTFGITWSFIMSRDHNSHSGVGVTMHHKGWIAGIGAIILGILIILDELNIFSLWREL